MTFWKVASGAVIIVFIALAIVFSVVTNNEYQKDFVWQHGDIVLCNVTANIGDEILVSYKENRQWVRVTYEEWSSLPSAVMYSPDQVTDTVPCRTDMRDENSLILVWHKNNSAYAIVLFFLSIIIVWPGIGAVVIWCFARLNLNVKVDENLLPFPDD